MKRTSLGLAALSLALTAPIFGGAVILTGNTALGVNDQGHLNIAMDGPFGFQGYGVFRGNTDRANGGGDATYPGCTCEGWGLMVTGPSGMASGGANSSVGGVFGLTGGTFSFNATSATSSIGLSNAPISIVHQYGPSGVADIFVGQITITNNSLTDTFSNVTYRRAMDWDVPPTEFNEYVTHQGIEQNLTTNGGKLLFASNNGFAAPTGDPGEIYAGGSATGTTINTDFFQYGGADHGSVFDFDLGTLAPGQSTLFNIYYGSRANLTDAYQGLFDLSITSDLNGTAAPGSLYSLGQSTASEITGYETYSYPIYDYDNPEYINPVYDDSGNLIGYDDIIYPIVGYETYEEPIYSYGPANDSATFIFAFGGVGAPVVVEPGDGTTPFNPLIPPDEDIDFDPATGITTYTFVNPPPRLWFDPPYAKEYEYVLYGGATFTEVAAPPAGFGYGILTFMSSLGSFAMTPGVVYDLVGLGFGGLDKFTITGLSATAIDFKSPGFASAFPVFLDWTGPVTKLEVNVIPFPPDGAVPEPSTYMMLGAGIAALAWMRKRQG
jgi:hypothetical protein